MNIWGLTKQDMNKAMEATNRQYDDNVEFNKYPEKAGNGLSFTLRVKSSKEAGHRLGFSGKRMVSACWHVHRDFMSACFAINPEARIKSAVADYQGIADFNYSFEQTGDDNIGSQVQPLCFREACECEPA
jgi:hypothetical protein